MTKRALDHPGRPKRLVRKKCAGNCNLVRPREEYTVTQWDKRVGQAFCKECVHKERRLWVVRSCVKSIQVTPNSYEQRQTIMSHNGASGRAMPFAQSV